MLLLKETLLILSLVLTGCTAFSPDGGLSGVNANVQKHVKQDVVWPKTVAEQSQVTQRVSQLLKQTLDVDAAVQVALLNNKDLQATLYTLGIAESDVVQAGHLPNPKFSMLFLFLKQNLALLPKLNSNK